MAMEAATTKQDSESVEGVSSFAKSLFLGEIHEDLVFPYPPSVQEKEPRVKELVDSAREWSETIYDQRKAEEDRWIGDDMIRELGDRGLMGLYVPDRVRRPGAVADRLLPRVRGVRPDRRDLVGRHGRAPVDRHEGHRALRQRRAEGALPARPGQRAQAGRVRADRAERRVRRLPRRVARGEAARRLVEAERPQALHRQRLQGRRVRDVRPRRGRRQGQAHRADPRARHGRLRGRRALRHDGPARERPAPAPLQRRPRAARRTCSASPARASASRCTSSTTGACRSARGRSAAPSGCSTGSSSTSRSASSSAGRSATSSSSRRRSAGWSRSRSAWSRWPT